jgi:hypothetical protein
MPLGEVVPIPILPLCLIIILSAMGVSGLLYVKIASTLRLLEPQIEYYLTTINTKDP